MSIYAPDFVVDVTRSILWQYDDSEKIRSLVESKAAWYRENVTDFWNWWLVNVFDLRTANQFGLNVWAIILGMPVTGPESTGKDGPAWAFGSLRQNFGHGNFGSSGGVRPLLPEQLRTLLRLRYLQMTSRGTIPETNRFLSEIFTQGAYVIDNHDMTMTTIFESTLDADIRYMLDTMDMIPRPSGVKMYWDSIPSCAMPTWNTPPTDTVNIYGGQHTFYAVTSNCSPYVLYMNRVKSDGDISIALSDSAGNFSYQVWINGGLSASGYGADGVVWGPGSPNYFNDVEAKVIIFGATINDSASATINVDAGLVTYDNWPAESLELSQPDLTSGTLETLPYPRYTIPEESLELSQPTITGGSLT